MTNTTTHSPTGGAQIDLEAKRKEFEEAYFRQYPNSVHANPNKFARDENGDYHEACVFVAWDMWQIALARAGQQARAQTDHTGAANCPACGTAGMCRQYLKSPARAEQKAGEDARAELVALRRDDGTLSGVFVSKPAGQQAGEAPLDSVANNLEAQLRAIVRERDDLRAQLASAQESTLKFGIEVEKELCKALGREWSTSGISIESLIAQLASAQKDAEDDRLTPESLNLLRKGLRDWEVPENRYAAQRVLDAIAARAQIPNPARN